MKIRSLEMDKIERPISQESWRPIKSSKLNLKVKFLKSKFFFVELETHNLAAFEWYNIRPNEGWTSIEFNVTAPENAHIGLTDSLDILDALVEIRIGEAANTLIQITELGSVKNTFAIANLLNGDEMRTFRIQWGNRMILMFKNNELVPFHGYFMGIVFPVNFFGLRTQ